MGYAGAAMYDWFVVNQVKNVSKTKEASIIHARCQLK